MGGKPGLVLLSCSPNFRCHFHKKMMALLMFVVFQQLTWEKNVKINIPKFVCREAAMGADVTLDATTLNLKKPENSFVCWVTDMKYKPILSLK